MKPRDNRPFRLAISILAVHTLVATASVAGRCTKPNPAVQPGTLGRDVNPLIGTGGLTYLCGNNFPGATVPFGMVRLSPDTVSLLGSRATNSSGYFYSDPRILGFSHTRLAGTGATDGGNFLVIPCIAETAKSYRRGLDSAYSHEQERAFPGYYGVALPSLGITAELTATHRVGVHRYTFPEHQRPATSDPCHERTRQRELQVRRSAGAAGVAGNRRGRADVRHVFQTVRWSHNLLRRAIQSTVSRFRDLGGRNGNPGPERAPPATTSASIWASSRTTLRESSSSSWRSPM